MSTSSLIWPSYTIRATIFEKVFQPENSPKLSIWIPSVHKFKGLSIKNLHSFVPQKKFQDRSNKVLQRKKKTSPPNEWHNIPLPEPSFLKSQFYYYPPTSEASRRVYWNQAQKNFTHPYTEYPWVSVTLSLCNSVANKPPIIFL